MQKKCSSRAIRDIVAQWKTRPSQFHATGLGKIRKGPCDAWFGVGSSAAIDGTISRVCAGDDCSRGKVAHAFSPRGANVLMGEIKFNIVCDTAVVGCDTLSEIAWRRFAWIVSREHTNW